MEGKAGTSFLLPSFLPCPSPLPVLNLFPPLLPSLLLSVSPIGALCQVVYSQIKLGQTDERGGTTGPSVLWFLLSVLEDESIGRTATNKSAVVLRARERKYNKASLILMNSLVVATTVSTMYTAI